MSHLAFYPGLSPNRSRLAIVITLIAALAAFSTPGTIRADDSCDTTEQVACIPISSSDSPPQGGGATGSGVAAGSATNAPSAAAAPVPIPPIGCYAGACCPIPASGAAESSPSIAVPGVPVSPCVVFPPIWCYPLPASAASPAANAPAAAAPIAAPYYPCSPYRSIYATINLGNAAEVRALRTLSSDGLRTYWRRDALSAIQEQVASLELSGVNASARLISITVQGRSIDPSSSTAHVRTLEHWQVDERSLFDGTLVLSQDQQVVNSYTLSFLGDGWYITNDTMTVLPGPAGLPIGG